MEAKLIVVGGRASKGAISLKLPTLVGRSRQAGLTVAHPMVSRRHAELFEASGLLMIRDLGSLNGTLMDGRRIKEAPLPPDAEFTIGPLTFQAKYEYEGDLSKLPAPVLADEPHEEVATTEAWGEVPDFELIEEPPAKKSPSKKELAKKQSAEKEPAKKSTGKKQPAKKQPAESEPAQESTGDPFEDLLNDL